MFELPEEVAFVREVLEKHPEEPLHEVAMLLMVDSPELAAMWKALERRRYTGDPKGVWVWQFLTSAAEASSLPTFHYKSAVERRELAEEIQKISMRLARLLEYNDLDANFIDGTGKLFNGFFIYEDFAASNRARVDASGAHKLKASVAIKAVADRAAEKIKKEPAPGKAGANAKAVRFVRLIANQNQEQYGEPLNAVVASAANAIFATSYRESDIRNLMAR